MNNLPGPYIKDFFVSLGNKKFYTLIAPFLNKEKGYDAIDLCYLGFYMNSKEEGNREPMIIEGKTYGNIVLPVNNEKDEYKWCYFFIPEGEDIPYGLMTVEQKNKVSARN